MSDKTIQLIPPSAVVCSASSLTACEKFVPRPLSTDSISRATSSGILTDVTAVFPPASKPVSTGSKGMSPSSTIWKAKLLIAQVGSTPMLRSVPSNDAFRSASILTDSFLIFALLLILRPLLQGARLPRRPRPLSMKASNRILMVLAFASRLALMGGPPR